MNWDNEPMDKQTENIPKNENKEKKDFLVSVMPKEYRGKEGLTRQSWNGVVSAAPKQEIVMPVAKAVPEPITPSKLREQTLTQVPPPVKKKMLWIVVVAGAVLLGGLAVGAYFVLKPSEPERPASKPPVVQTPPTLPPASSTRPTNIPKVDTAPAKIPDPFAGESLPGRDTDSDGLTDIEEVLYGTVTTRPDSDSDGFLDGNEVFHLYNPNGLAPETLLDTGFVSWFTQNSFNFRVQIMKRWTPKVNEAKKELIISSPTGESFQIVSSGIGGGQSIQDWYKTQSDSTDTVLEPFRTKQGFEGAWATDHLTGYVRFSDTELLIFTYQLGQARRVEYRQSFEMLINSLEKLK